MLRSFQFINRACETASGYVVRMYEVVRQHARQHRRTQPPPRNLRRVNLPMARPACSPTTMSPPAPPQCIIEPLFDRKRKATESLSPMSRVKRQDHGYFKSSPWSNETWAQHCSGDLDTKSEDARKTRLRKCQERRSQRLRYTWNPYKYERPPSPKIVKPHRVKFRPQRADFLDHSYFAPDEPDPPERWTADETMLDDQEDSLHLNIDEEALQTTEFALPSIEETEDAPPIVNDSRASSVGRADEEEDSRWDEEGNREHRKLLRSLPESHDEDGYKVPIYGTISPETQAWNREHGKKLLEEAALNQQTPSRLPKHSVSSSPSSSSPSYSEDELRLSSPGRSTTDASSPTVTLRDEEKAFIRGDHGEEPTSPPRTATAREASIPVVSESTDAKNIKSQQTPSSILLPGIQNLSLKPPPRTPKSQVSQEEKDKLRTRTQKRRAEIEAAKNAYPLVPLSKNWDAKVRHAVNHGHGRFEATMFNKCVPEYSNDPNARSLWLDDAVINDYVVMVAKHGSKDDRKDQVRSVAALSSFFFTKISSAKPNYPSCAGMLKRAGIPGKKLLDCEKVFIPINRTYHWTLAVIEPNVPEGLTAVEHKRRLTIYNSMGSSGGRQVAMSIMSWIQHDLGVSFKEEEWEIDPVGESPQQRNTDDCGVFTCTTARQIMLDKYDNEQDRYKETDIREMRKRIVAELVNGDLLNKDDSAA